MNKSMVPASLSQAFQDVSLHKEEGCLKAGGKCPTAQVVLNISQFSQRTVELLRTT